jgi:hypothetical protein
MSAVAGIVICGRYLLLEPVGEGGMGRVWRGHDRVLDREVAVKEILLPPGLSAADRDDLIARTQREAHAAGKIDHPSVITIYDVVEHDAVPWIVMRFVRGPSLGSEIRRNGRLPWQQVAEIGEQVAGALAEAHAVGIVHRDLKPDNILLPGRRAIVTDFGIAHIANATRVTAPGTAIGTPRYMAPEQFDNRDVGPATDMWALGATLYTATEGRPPFDGQTLIAIAGAVLTRPHQPLQHAGPLTQLIEMLLSKDPARRPPAATAARLLATYRTARDAHGDGIADPPQASLGWVTDVPRDATITAPSAPAPARSAPTRLMPPGGGVGRHAGRRPRRTRAVAIAAVTGTAAVIAAVALFLSHSSGAHSGGSSGASVNSGWITAAPSAPVSDPGNSGNAMALSGTALAVGDDKSNDTELFDAATGKLIAPLRDPNSTGVSAVAFGPGGTLAAGDSDGNVYLWDAAGEKLIAVLPAPPLSKSISSLAFGPGGTLAVGESNGSTYLWDVASRNLITTFPASPLSRGVSSVAFGSGDTVAVSDYNSSISLWDAASQKLITTFNGPVGHIVYSVAFGPGDTLAIGDGNGNVYLWDVATKRFTATLTGPVEDGVFSVAFGPGDTLAAGHFDGSTYLWDVATRKVTDTIPGGGGSVLSVAFGPGYASLVTGTQQGVIKLWKVVQHQPR